MSDNPSGEFQSALPLRGATNSTVRGYHTVLFQSALPLRGATLTSSGMPAHVTISIRAPLAGSDQPQLRTWHRQ